MSWLHNSSTIELWLNLNKKADWILWYCSRKANNKKAYMMGNKEPLFTTYGPSSHCWYERASRCNVKLSVLFNIRSTWGIQAPIFDKKWVSNTSKIILIIITCSISDDGSLLINMIYEFIAFKNLLFFSTTIRKGRWSFTIKRSVNKDSIILNIQF